MKSALAFSAFLVLAGLLAVYVISAVPPFSVRYISVTDEALGLHAGGCAPIRVLWQTEAQTILRHCGTNGRLFGDFRKLTFQTQDDCSAQVFQHLGLKGQYNRVGIDLHLGSDCEGGKE